MDESDKESTCGHHDNEIQVMIGPLSLADTLKANPLGLSEKQKDLRNRI